MIDHELEVEFHAIIEEIKILHDKKMADYGDDEDPWANLNASTQLGVEPWIGCVLRANDKMKRVQSFVKKGNLVNESLADSLLDIPNYFILALALYRVKERKENAQASGANRSEKLSE